MKYPLIEPMNEKVLLNPLSMSSNVVSKFIAHTRYCVCYDKYLFDLAQKSYVSHINGYKEHLAKFIFPFDRLLFVHVAVGFGLLYLPQLADLKKYALVWPQFTRLQAKNITKFHSSQIEEIKKDEAELKKERQLKAIEKRQLQEKEKRKEREFNEKQREKKRKNRTKITYEEVRKEWEDLGDELKEFRKKTRVSGKKSNFE